MHTLTRLFLTISFSWTVLISVAQPKKLSPTQKFKPPKLMCTLGAHSDSAKVTVQEAVQLVKLPIKVTDEQKNNYTIASYQFMYTRKAVTENEETGKVTPAASTVGDLFKVTPLPDLWKNTIAEQLQSGEELFFFDIIVKDAKGRLMFAPTIKIKVK